MVYYFHQYIKAYYQWRSNWAFVVININIETYVPGLPSVEHSEM